jgi:hypothetical protein
MDVPYEFEEVGSLFAEERLVAVLEQVTVSSVATVIRYRIAGQEPPHERGEWHGNGSQQKMDVLDMSA